MKLEVFFHPHHCKPVFSKRIFLLLLSMLFSLSRMKAADTNLPALNLITAKRPLVIGHRGYCQFAPENTLPSFKLAIDRKSTRLNSSHVEISYAVFCLKKKKKKNKK